MALTKEAERAVSPTTIAGLLRRSMEMEHLKSSTTRVKTILRHLQRKLPTEYKAWMTSLNLPVDTPSDSTSSSEAAAKELKKKQALERQAKVMAQFKQQQDSFMQNQTIDWGIDDMDDEEMPDAPEPERVATFPSGVCILCQEETDGEKLYGTFAFITESRVFRKTPIESHHDRGWVREIFDSPPNLDRVLENRPFGYANNNARTLTKRMVDGTAVEQIRQDLSKGFPADSTEADAISNGCGHIMHHSCFQVYIGATRRRHNQQIARHHPENLKLNEFLCPLCKALANAFLPIIWKPKTLSYPGPLDSQCELPEYMDSNLNSEKMRSATGIPTTPVWTKPDAFMKIYAEDTFISPLVTSIATAPATISPEQTFESTLIPGLPPIHFVAPEQRVMVHPSEINMPVTSPQSQSSTRTITPERVELHSVSRVYEELLDTLKKNGLADSEHEAMFVVGTKTPPWPHQFVQSFGATITSVEISQRGVDAEHYSISLRTTTSIRW
jgi:E3 ubiquitin-protein ligase UBR1